MWPTGVSKEEVKSSNLGSLLWEKLQLRNLGNWIGPEKNHQVVQSWYGKEIIFLYQSYLLLSLLQSLLEYPISPNLILINQKFEWFSWTFYAIFQNIGMRIHPGIDAPIILQEFYLNSDIFHKQIGKLEILGFVLAHEILLAQNVCGDLLWVRGISLFVSQIFSIFLHNLGDPTLGVMRGKFCFRLVM